MGNLLLFLTVSTRFQIWSEITDRNRQNLQMKSDRVITLT